MTAQHKFLQHFEQHQQDKHVRHVDSLFSLLPLSQGFTPKNIKLDSLGLYQTMRRSPEFCADCPDLPSSESRFLPVRAEWWARVLNMQRVRKLRPGWDFHFEIVTDGYAVSLTFAKPAATPSVPPAALDPTKLRLQDYDKVGLPPGLHLMASELLVPKTVSQVCLYAMHTKGLRSE